MAFRIKGSHLIAVAFAAGLGYWMVTGEYRIGGQNDASNGAPPIAEREEERGAELFKVRYAPLIASERSETVLIRGRTQANAIVTVRAETAGILEKRMVSKGDKVSEGDLVCVIENGAREAQLAQGRAQLAAAEAEYQSNLELSKKGFVSKNRVASFKAALDAGKAAFAASELELSRVEVRANANGVVQDPIAEVGDMLTMGGTCLTLIDTDPMLFTGQVSERDIGKISKGMSAQVELISGETVEGKLRYIAPSADAKTRTFLVEIEINTDKPIRDGLTAEAVILLPAGKAFKIAPSWVTLADDGTIGIRIVSEGDFVDFIPVKIVAQEKNGFWITGPKDGDRIITLGQEYVVKGEEVLSAPDERIGQKLADASNSNASTSNEGSTK